MKGNVRCPVFGSFHLRLEMVEKHAGGREQRLEDMAMAIEPNFSRRIACISLDIQDGSYLKVLLLELYNIKASRKKNIPPSFRPF